MTPKPRRTRPLRHVTATGAALAVALGPVVFGALLARSVGADPTACVNALIAGGGQRARISRAQLRTGARLRAGTGVGAGRLPGRGLRPGSAARPARREEALRRALRRTGFPHRAGRLDETGGGQEVREPAG